MNSLEKIPKRNSCEYHEKAAVKSQTLSPEKSVKKFPKTFFFNKLRNSKRILGWTLKENVGGISKGLLWDFG